MIFTTKAVAVCSSRELLEKIEHELQSTVTDFSWNTTCDKPEVGSEYKIRDFVVDLGLYTKVEIELEDIVKDFADAETEDMLLILNNLPKIKDEKVFTKMLDKVPMAFIVNYLIEQTVLVKKEYITGFISKQTKVVWELNS